MPLLASPRTDPSVPYSGTRLLPRVFDGEALVWPGMKDPGLGEKLVGYFQDPLPRRSVLLTAAPERTPPQADDIWRARRAIAAPIPPAAAVMSAFFAMVFPPCSGLSLPTPCQSPGA